MTSVRPLGYRPTPSQWIAARLIPFHSLLAELVLQRLTSMNSTPQFRVNHALSSRHAIAMYVQQEEFGSVVIEYGPPAFYSQMILPHTDPLRTQLGRRFHLRYIPTIQICRDESNKFRTGWAYYSWLHSIAFLSTWAVMNRESIVGIST